jgi:CBS domain-containing protein
LTKPGLRETIASARAASVEGVEMSGVNRLSQLLAGGSHRREVYHISLTLLFLVAGMFAVWFVHSVLEVEGDAILVAFLVVPLLLYLTLSGRVSELAAGSLSVKLNEVSREPVGQVATEYVIADLGPRSDPNQPIMKTDPNRAQVVTLRHGDGNYERDEVLGRLTNLAAMSPVPFLIVLDDRDRVVAYMTCRSALDVLERKERGDLFIELVNGGDPDVFDDGGGFSAVKTETLPYNATNAEALATLEQTGLDALVVVDRKGRFEGIVERDRVLTRMMLGLVSTPSGKG